MMMNWLEATEYIGDFYCSISNDSLQQVKEALAKIRELTETGKAEIARLKQQVAVWAASWAKSDSIGWEVPDDLIQDNIAAIRDIKWALRAFEKFEDEYPDDEDYLALSAKSTTAGLAANREEAA